MTSTSPSGRPAGPRRSTTPGIACPSGAMICGPPSSCGSPGAGSAPSVASVPGPPWWITSSPIGATGSCSSIRQTTRVYASTITTKRPPESRRKNGENQTEIDWQRLRKATSAHERERVCLPGCAQGQACGLPDPPRPRKSYVNYVVRPRGPSRVRKFPPSGFWTGPG